MRRERMKKIITLFILSLFLWPALVFGDAVSIRLGYFVPRAKSDLWDIEFENMDFTHANYQNSTLGFVFEKYLAPQLSLVIGVDGYSKNRAGFYKDYVGYSFEEGDFAFPARYYQGKFALSHVFGVSITPVQVGLKIIPLSHRASFSPYFGGGVGLYIWSVRLQGDMVDFSDPWIYEDPDLGDIDIYPIYPTNARDDNNFSFGFHAFAGLMYRVVQRMAIEAEFKYSSLRGNLKEGFEGFEAFDLSGYQFSIGINYRF